MKQKEQFKNSGPVDVTGPFKDYGPFYIPFFTLPS